MRADHPAAAGRRAAFSRRRSRAGARARRDRNPRWPLRGSREAPHHPGARALATAQARSADVVSAAVTVSQKRVEMLPNSAYAEELQRSAGQMRFPPELEA